MATATLVKRSANHLRYLLQSATIDIDSVVISTIGGPTPDILTDSVGTNGVIRALAKAFADGYGQISAGPMSAAQAASLWLSDGTVDPGNELTPTAVCIVTPLTGVSVWMVAANVDGGGHPLVVVGKANQNGALGPFGATDSAYLDIIVTGAIGT
jgi:hypothetical protein